MLRVYTIVLLISILLLGCTPIIPETSYSISEDLAKTFLQEHGYNIIRYDGNRHVTMTEDFIGTHEVRLSWQLIDVEPKELINEVIRVELFQVTDHVLDIFSEYDKTSIEVWIRDGEIIGGTSEPTTDIRDDTIDVAHKFTIFGERIGYKNKKSNAVNGVLKDF